MFNSDDERVGGFSENDGTIDFYLRVKSLLNEGSVVVDLGGGRAEWFEDDNVTTRRNIRHITPVVKAFIAIDVDEAVLGNKSSTRNIVYDGRELPLESGSVDLIVADYVLEHINDPSLFAAEVMRVLKPGGYLCARTPHKWHYVSIGARIINNSRHSHVLAYLQPGRNEEDVFPTNYLLNGMSDIRNRFSTFDNRTFLFRSNPSYYFGSRAVFMFLSFFHRIAPIVLVSNLFIFLRKPV